MYRGRLSVPTAMFFNGWSGLYRTTIVGVLAYVALVLLLRTSGKRTLSKMNAFDLVVTVALGSTLATILLNKDVALAEGVTAFGVLILLQFVVAWTSVRFPTARKLVKSEPALLFFRGVFLDESMRKERVTREEVHAAIRADGVSSMADVEAVVLETDGEFSVVRPSENRPTALEELTLSAAHSGREHS